MWIVFSIKEENGLRMRWLYFSVGDEKVDIK